MKALTIARIWPRYKGVFESRVGVINALDKSRFRTIHIYIAKGSDKPNQFEDCGSTVYYVTKRPNVRCFNALIIWRLLKILKKERVSILHCHKHKATVYGVFTSFFIRNLVVISHVHGINRTRNLRRKLLNCFLLFRFTRFVDSLRFRSRFLKTFRQ